jgi:hypothetical protein
MHPLPASSSPNSFRMCRHSRGSWWVPLADLLRCSSTSSDSSSIWVMPQPRHAAQLASKSWSNSSNHTCSLRAPYMPLLVPSTRYTRSS